MRGSQGTRCGRVRRDVRRQDVGDRGVVGCRRARPSTSRSSRPRTGSTASTTRTARRRRPRPARRRPPDSSSATSRDLPIPAGPRPRPAGPAPRVTSVSDRGQHGHLARAPDQRQRRARLAGGCRAAGRPRAARTGRDLPLTRNGGQLGGAEQRLRPRDHLRGGQHLSGTGLAHHPGGEVDRVALDRERTPERRARSRPANTCPRLMPMPQRQAPGTVQHLPGDAQHPLLVVVGAARRAGGEHDLAAVAVDVGLEERDVVVGAGVLDVAHDLVERVGEGASAPPTRGAASVPENCTKATVISRCSGSPAPPSRWARIGGGSTSGSEPVVGRAVLGVDVRRLPARSAAAGPRAGPRPGARRVQQRRSRAALRPIWPAAAADSISAVMLAAGPLISSSRWIVGVADEEEVEVTAVDADRHPQHDRARTLVGTRPITPQCRPHPVGRASRALRVVRPLEQQQHRVATPLDQVGAVVRGPPPAGRRRSR